MSRFVLIFGAILLSSTSILAQKITVCYVGTWAHYRTGNGNFEAEDIDPTLCTHIMYTFFGLEPDGSILSLDAWLDYDLENVQRFANLKTINPNVKLLASIGGWSQGSERYSAIAASSAYRENLATSSVAFLRQHGFDGIDFDWEYPGQRGGAPEDKDNFVTLLQTLSNALKPAGYLLTIAVGATPEHISSSYNVPEIVKYVDFINVMTYDLFGSWGDAAYHHSPLYAPTGATEEQAEFNLNALGSYWASQGAPKSKLLLGLAFYGRTYTLADSQQNEPGAAISGPGNGGVYTQEPGFLGYNEFCESGGWTTVFDTDRRVPYAVNGNQWIGYDDASSIEEKSRFAASNGYGGVIVWSIETDDFRGVCGGEKFPLLRAINRGLKRNGRKIKH